MNIRAFFMLRSGKWETRLKAVTSLDYDPTSQVMDRLLRDPVANVRAAALYRWGRRFVFTDLLRPLLFRLLREDPAADVRAAAANAFMYDAGGSGDEWNDMLDALLHAALHDQQPVVTVGATAALAQALHFEKIRLPSGKGRELSLEVFLRDKLGSRGLPIDRLQKVIRTGATYGVAQIREAAMLVLQPLATKEDLPLLRVVAQDREPHIRELAVQAIGYVERLSSSTPA